MVSRYQFLCIFGYSVRQRYGLMDKKVVNNLVACPCSIIMATSIPMISGVNNSAKNGILIKRSNHLEKVSQIKTVAFNITGTLTEGKLQVVR